MDGATACLIDVYETALRCDFSGHRAEMPGLAGLPPAVWNEAFIALGPHVTDGRLSMAEAYAETLRRGGLVPDDALVDRLVARDRELLLKTAHVPDDTFEFLTAMRERGVKTALVSNCAENTRSLLDELGLVDLVDAVVLSCEVRSAKPHPAIYEAALALLGVGPADALFVDDQDGYCAGAAALGIRTVRIDRDATTPADGVVTRLTDLVPMW